MFITLIKTIILGTIVMEGNSSQLKEIQMNHRLLPVTVNKVQYLASLTDTNHINEVLNNILIPRVVGTKNHGVVFEYIKSQLENLHWFVEIDTFQDNTPVGPKIFKNIIATLNPNADRFLVLACHYDSKFYENIVFVGATDSAVPCAMMLNLIKVLDRDMKTLHDDASLSLKLVFFDGEEAFENWGPNDSIYGAKHLAKLWESRRSLCKLTNEMVTDLERVDMLILLDLIGHKGTRFLSAFDNTLPWFLQLTNIEDELLKLNLLENTFDRYFYKKKYLGYIEDDHIPFMQRNVPILHLISVPFPTAWHTVNDNRSIIDMKTVEDINKILRVFVVQYLTMLVK